jgi:hypothetical protein
MMPESECNRRNQNEIPRPARREATPARTVGAAGLAVAATETILMTSEMKK